ncbi:MAG TPA: hypothetical protein PLS94_15600 [Prolixibacteraceae bacterium]|nr:hypothetical protein [Prolixibacteraceae bacterium]
MNDIPLQNNDHDFDFLFEGFNFMGGITALAALNNGLKIAIRLKLPFGLQYEPDLSFFYPRMVGDTLSSLNNYRFMAKVSKLFPHHFFPQRVITFNKKLDATPKFNALYDKAMGFGREETTFPIVSSNIEDFKAFADTFPKGNLAFEFRFDRNMAIFDLLRICKQNGAAIFKPNSEVTAKTTIHCEPFSKRHIVAVLNEVPWPLQNPMRIDKPGFSLTFQALENKTLLCFYPFVDVLRFDWVKHEIEGIFSALSIKKAKPFWNQLDDFFVRNDEANPSQITLFDEDFISMKKALSAYFKQIKTETRKSFDINHIQKFARFELISNDHFRQIQADCDTKFDVAKQSGVSYQLFSRMFYRYRESIDEFTEKAYELMEKSRDAEKNWGEVERGYLENEFGKLNLI